MTTILHDELRPVVADSEPRVEILRALVLEDDVAGGVIDHEPDQVVVTIGAETSMHLTRLVHREVEAVDRTAEFTAEAEAGLRVRREKTERVGLVTSSVRGSDVEGECERKARSDPRERDTLFQWNILLGLGLSDEKPQTKPYHILNKKSMVILARVTREK